MTRLAAQHLTRADIGRIEAALTADDLEVMVAAVDQIVARRLHAARHTQETLTYRKPGGTWLRRTVPLSQVTRTILKLEDQGAEIVTPR